MILYRNLLNDLLNLRTLNVIWKEIVDEIIQWSAICIANEKCQKYK
jgi:hypothetical protein